MRPLEGIDSLFVDAEGVLKVSGVLEEGTVVEDCLRSCQLHVQHLLIYRPDILEAAEGGLDIRIEGPDLMCQGRRHHPVRSPSRRPPRARLLQYGPSRLVVVVSDVHLRPGTPHGRKLVQCLIVDSSGLQEDLVGVFKVVAFLVELGEADPQTTDFPVGVLRVDLQHGLGVGLQREEFVELLIFAT